MSLLKVLCFLTCVLGACAFKLNIESRIINGEDVTDADNTGYIVSLRTTVPGVLAKIGLVSGGAHFCGGGIISSLYMLTAAHCVTDAKFQILPSLLLYAMAGLKDLNGTGTKIPISKVILHANYDETEFANDIAALRAATTIGFSSTVYPMDLPNVEGDVPIADSSVLAIGWGIYSNDNNALPNRLQKANLQVISIIACQNEYAEYGYADDVTPNNICTQQPNKGTCSGDSGSPVASNGKKLVAIVSWGSIPCASGLPDVFTNVFRHRPWIAQQTGV